METFVLGAAHLDLLRLERMVDMRGVLGRLSLDNIAPESVYVSTACVLGIHFVFDSWYQNDRVRLREIDLLLWVDHRRVKRVGRQHFDL